MTNKLSKIPCIALLGIVICAGLNAEAADSVLVPKRISAKLADVGKVHPVYMVSGMVSIIEIPEKVTGIRLGNPNTVTYFQPEHPDNEVSLVLKGTHPKPTNLIIRSGKTKYVFDIIPNQKVHQDTLEIVGAYGGPELSEPQGGVKLIDASDERKGGNSKEKTEKKP